MTAPIDDELAPTTTADRPTSQPGPAALSAGPGPSLLARFLPGGVLILIGLLWAIERAGVVDLSATAVLGIATAVVGMAAIVGSFDAEHSGLVVFGLVLASITALTAAAPIEGFQGGLGNLAIEPTSLDELNRDYELGAGTLELDLRQLPAGELTERTDPVEVTINVGVGDAIVHLPAGIDVAVDGEAAMGEVTLLDQSVDGVFVEDSYRSDDASSGEPDLVLDVNVLIGSVEVDQP